MTPKEKHDTSKFLSLVLRHKPEKIDLAIDKDGWANVDELLKKMDIGFEFLKEVVDTNDKKRFKFSDDFKKIRANQGHSINVDLKLEPIDPPDILFHGTTEKNIASIFENGILKQSRNYVHLSVDRETAKKVGMRYGRSIVIEIQALKMHQDGYSFYLAENGVWLTDFVPVKYLADPA